LKLIDNRPSAYLEAVVHQLPLLAGLGIWSHSGTRRSALGQASV